MRTWLRSFVNAILGTVPGKTGRTDTATRMAMDADFNYRLSAAAPFHSRERDDGPPVKPIELSADRALFEQLVRIVSEAQERDADDERRLYRPTPGAWNLLAERRRPDPTIRRKPR
jgi:hypothetical protein